MAEQSIFFNAVLVLCATAVLTLLFRPRLIGSRAWQATITPLASIIGSGFLVVAPLLHHIVGGYAPVAILAVILLAYSIGTVLRHNIANVEPRLSGPKRSRYLYINEQVAHLVLALAYLVSVAFYLRLMSAFILQLLGISDDLAANVITTGFLLFILSASLWHGLSGLEKLEEFAVHIKLAIIAALLIGLAAFDLHWLAEHESMVEHTSSPDTLQTLRLLGGVLLVVQGFETSRYLGDEYNASMRIRTMRMAQIIAGVIYFVFVVLALPVMVGFDRQPSETAIIDVGGKVAVVLPYMLILAAVMSQFSASVADTVGAGGLLEEASGKRIRPRIGYALISIVAIVLVWISDIFEIISLASRAFALYYAVQCISAIIVVLASTAPWPRKGLKLLGVGALAAVMLLIAVFALPAGH